MCRVKSYVIIIYKLEDNKKENRLPLPVQTSVDIGPLVHTIAWEARIYNSQLKMEIIRDRRVTGAVMALI